MQVFETRLSNPELLKCLSRDLFPTNHNLSIISRDFLATNQKEEGKGKGTQTLTYSHSTHLTVIFWSFAALLIKGHSNVSSAGLWEGLISR